MKKYLIAMICSLSMAATYAQVPMVKLANGVEMPQFGIGTFNVPSNEICKDAVLTALRAGYRHIDTAHAYMDERGVGEAVNEFVAEGGCKREEIWVTSKIWPSEYADPTAIDRMLRRLNLDYVDLVYPHQPVGDIKAAWHNLEAAVKQGKVRALGLSNFEVPGAESLFQWCVDSTEIKPVIMQMECHPYAQRIKERALAGKYGMKVECWFPLGGAMSQRALLKDPVIMKIAEAHKVSPAQVIIRWEMQEGLLTIPGATDPDYISKNIAAAQSTVNGKPFALTPKEMKQMRMRLTDAVFGRLVVDVRELFAAMPSELKTDLDGEFLTAIAEQPNNILKCAMYLFLGYLDGTSQFAQSCGGGGSSSDLPWGRKEDEDDRRFAYRCMMHAHKMLKPSQPKRGISGRR